MFSLSFITPAALALLLLIPLMWAFALLTPRRLSAWRFWVTLALRSVILASLVLALAGVQLVRPVQAITTVFLIDASDSVAPAQRDRAVRYVEDALRQMPPGDQAAVVVFGENALVERVPSNLTTLNRISSVPVTTRTNIQDAVQLGLALLPADTQKRLVLLSDGGENSGRAGEAARLAEVRGVPLDVVPLFGERGPDVIVSALHAPAAAREGQDATVVASIRSSFATTGRLQLFVDGQIVREQDVTLNAGQNDVPVQIRSGEAGFRRIEVRLEAQGDTTVQNNRAATFTEVQGPPRMLLIASEAARAANLRDALTAAGVRVDVRSPSDAPASLTQLNQYAGVVLVDTPSRLVPQALMEALPLYVRELGRGFAMIGGTESFGAGGYRRTRIEEVLPVNLDPLDMRQQPDLALVMVIDRSGSMGEKPTDAGGRSKLDLAKEAVYQASLGLSQQDQIGLVAFDFGADWILNMQRLPSAVEIEQALSRFDANGGTDIRPAMTLAVQSLANANARIKHVILLTDGIADSNYSDLVDQMRSAGTTISTVAIGADSNPNLEQIASQGGGRFYRVTKIEDVPRIFLEETVIVAGRDIVEEQFTPTVALPAPVVRGFSLLPPLFGYNGTEIKPAARAILVTPDGKPVLAQWQYGLGRSVAWTSDLQGRWAREWVGWQEFPRFAGGLADMLLPPRLGDRLTLQASNLGAESALEVTAQDADGRPLNDLALQGRLLNPDNQSDAVQFVQIGPGRYRATAPTSTPGVYLAQVAATNAQGEALGSASTGLVVSYSPEYSETRENPELLRDLAGLTGGREAPPPEAVFEPSGQRVGSVSEIGLLLLWLALLLLPLDIMLRRLSIRWRELLPGMVTARRQPARVPAPTTAMARLSAAKQRARPARAESVRPAVAPVVVTAEPGVATSVRPDVDEKARRAATPAPSTADAQPPAARGKQPAPAESEAPREQDRPPSQEDTLARLMAAKRRARSKKEGT